MIISANQPYFAPFPGFFTKALLSDVLVILDEVQFPRGTTWISRNRFKNDQGELWLTIPIWKKGLGEQNINRVRICYEGRWLRKHLESLKTAYGNAPYLGDHLRFLEELFVSRFDKLIDLNLALIRYLLDYLHAAGPSLRVSGYSQGNPTSHRDLQGNGGQGLSGPEPGQEVPRSTAFPAIRHRTGLLQVCSACLPAAVGGFSGQLVRSGSDFKLRPQGAGYPDASPALLSRR
jgi:hypothetical protein